MSRPLPRRPNSGRPPGRRTVVAALGALGLAAVVSGCGLVSNDPQPSAAVGTASPTASHEPATPEPTPAPTPAPTVRPVRSIVMVADVGETQAATPSAVAWLGVQKIASDLGATSSMTIPRTAGELSAAIGNAATSGADVVVSLGVRAAAATLTAAMANPAVQFFSLNQAVSADAPGNLHAIAFDESEMGYLAGAIAGSLSRTASVGLVGDEDSSVATANYGAGFRNGALFADPAATVNLAYAGTPDDPAKGRAAEGSLAAGKADVIAATLDLSGIGAMREACARGSLVVALDADAWLLAPDIRPCLVTSVRKLYDVAIESAIREYAAGGNQKSVFLADVAGGGIGLSDFHVTEPAALTARLDRVVGDMRAGPPRPTAPPTAAPTPAPTEVPTATPSEVPSVDTTAS